MAIHKVALSSVLYIELVVSGLNLGDLVCLRFTVGVLDINPDVSWSGILACSA